MVDWVAARARRDEWAANGYMGCSGIDVELIGMEYRAALDRMDMLCAERDEDIKTAEAWADLSLKWQHRAERYMTERDAAATRAIVAERCLDAVLALHQPSAEWRIDAGGGDEIELCNECDHEWPCPTVRAIEGDDATP